MGEPKDKLKKLLNFWPEGAVFSTAWLNEQGYSNQLLAAYKHSGWVASIGTGAVVRAGVTPTLEGAMYALQMQLGLCAHFGGKTALGLVGKLHDVPIGKVPVQICFSAKQRLPSWLLAYQWELPLLLHKSSLFDDDTVGLQDYVSGALTIKISSPARAVLELLHMAETDDDLRECFELIRSLRTLVPEIVEALLSACTSIKAKRLFLYFAEKAHHFWVDEIDLTRIKIGTGKRIFVSGDRLYVNKYLMTVPKILSYNNGPEIQEAS